MSSEDAMAEESSEWRIRHDVPIPDIDGSSISNKEYYRLATVGQIWDLVKKIVQSVQTTLTEIINTKADKSTTYTKQEVDNLISQITRWDIPNYNAGVPFDFNTNFTAPDNGVVFIQYSHNGSHGNNGVVYINGTNIHTLVGDSYNHSVAEYPLAKGSVFNFTTTMSKDICVFYPFKGV